MTPNLRIHHTVYIAALPDERAVLIYPKSGDNIGDPIALTPGVARELAAHLARYADIAETPDELESDAGNVDASFPDYFVEEAPTLGAERWN